MISFPVCFFSLQIFRKYISILSIYIRNKNTKYLNLESYMQREKLAVNVEKTKIMIFRKGGGKIK